MRPICCSKNVVCQEIKENKNGSGLPFALEPSSCGSDGIVTLSFSTLKGLIGSSWTGQLPRLHCFSTAAPDSISQGKANGLGSRAQTNWQRLSPKASWHRKREAVMNVRKSCINTTAPRTRRGRWAESLRMVIRLKRLMTCRKKGTCLKDTNVKLSVTNCSTAFGGYTHFMGVCAYILL